MDEKPKRNRERSAVLLLVALLVAGACALFWYITGVGHSWNYAATAINDRAGSLDGYTVVLVDGVAKATNSVKDREQKQAQTVESEKRLAEIEESIEDSGLEADAVAAVAKTALDAAERLVSEDATSDETALLAKAGASAALYAELNDDAAVNIDDVAQEYHDKGADVLVIPDDALTRYTEPTILRRGGKRIGVLSVPKVTTTYAVQQLVLYLMDHEVDYIVAVTTDDNLVAGTSNIDVVVTLDEAEPSTLGRTGKSGRYIFDAPDEGEVGVVIISPTGMASSKIVS